jgi:hypothetical protein
VAFAQRDVEVTANHEWRFWFDGFSYEAEYRDYLI